MLSHLRFHRRGPSNPSSPVPDQASPWEQPERPQAAHDASPHPDSRSRSPNPSMPLSLPPIPRATSSDADPTLGSRDNDALPTRDTFSPPGRTPHSTGESGFIGGVALRRAQQAGRQEPSAMASPQITVPESRIARAKPPPPPINTNISLTARSPLVSVPHAKAGSSFVSPVEMQNMGSFISGMRPAGTRLMSEPPVPAASSQAQAEAHKAKKGLPFLKNPMSTLLMRRRTGQSSDTAVPAAHEVPQPSYDPRIRGTRVHDFSAPRQPRRIVSNTAASTLGARADSELELHKFPTLPSGLPILSPDAGPGGKSESSARPDSQPVEVNSPSNSKPERRLSQEASKNDRRLSFDEKPLPEEPLPPVPPKDEPTSSGTLFTKSRPVSSRVDSVATRSMASTGTAWSHKVSLSGTSTKDSIMSALPKHMKSTSSRFSFDMIGAAKQEKLLEERHRQRELGRKVSDPKPSVQQDSRFDDFDDDFDYDAMMDDDGLEERIPGVNADYDEDEDQLETGFEDPDNDQENFAGFIFQRSSPQSSLASPDVPTTLVTPRDATGQVIGFAATKDATPEMQPATSPLHRLDPASYPIDDGTISGLGIQGLGITEESPYEPSLNNHQGPPALLSLAGRKPAGNDDLYFDEGLMEELNSYEDEIQTGTFDESIFDANDTDQYGRPIPGAFAQAQAMAAARAEEQARRESDMTSRFSAQSGVSESTTQTSLSVGPQRYPSVKEEEPQTSSAFPQHDTEQFIPPTQLTSQDKIAAYQAALAEAAHKAAASGKFRRDPSPSPPPPAADLTLTSPATGSEPHTDGQATHDPVFDNGYDDADGFGHEDLDEYDFDDEAIIAEANASALANDSDGWYGEEFGFYSAPASQPHHGHGSSNNSRVSSAPLNAQNLFEYASGGYFGPSGVVRSKSGRVVSREPNLTPITERSEYSNRNSIMSLALPPALGSDPRSPSSLQSPGLAQLAMIADDSEMSLSALMKLRNKAWGGSQASLGGSPREGSPRSDRGGGTLEGREGAVSPWSTASASAPAYLGISGPASHARTNSNFSLYSRDSDLGSASGSPTLTMNMSLPGSVPTSEGGGFNSGGVQPVFSPPPPPIPQPSPGPQCPPVMEDEELMEQHSAGAGSNSMSGSGVWMKSPAPTESSQTNVLSPISPPPSLAGGELSPAATATATAGPGRPGMGHRHKGSADSISYVKEEDSGETRWVVERRRTGEGGEVEILGREVVEGGRI